MSATATALQAVEPGTPRVNIEELEQLVARQLPRFYKQAYRQLENPHDAEDAVQDALVSAYKNLSQFRGTAQLSTWLMAIVINTARMQIRRRRRLISFEEQVSASEKGITVLDIVEDKKPSPEEICANSELCSLLAKAINRLSPALRRATRLYYVDGMTAVQASEVLGVPVGTIKARLARSRAKLAILLRGEPMQRASSPRSTNSRPNRLRDERSAFTRNARRSRGVEEEMHYTNASRLSELESARHAALLS